MKKEELKQDGAPQQTEEEAQTKKFIQELNELQGKYKRTLYAVNTVNEKGEIGPIVKILINK